MAVFATAVLVLNATPGVDFLLTVSRTLQGGVRAGVAAALGICVGCIGHILAAAFGLAALLALHPAGFKLIQWVGAAYLAWLGLGMLRQAMQGGVPQVVSGTSEQRAWWADFRTGVLTNLLNPKIALFFLAFLPQFVPADSPDKTLSFLLLSAAFVVQGLVFLLVLVAVAARLSRMGFSPGVRRGLQALGGGLFLALALRLAVGEQPRTS
ncbi:MAG TPA: LysE family translocator [Rubrivivax sp.]|jgi:threonine/homoserine/homoserine lactone efflux protein|nr:LysE family translocator [Rubrivivax sp.]